MTVKCCVAIADPDEAIDFVLQNMRIAGRGRLSIEGQLLREELAQLGLAPGELCVRQVTPHR